MTTFPAGRYFAATGKVGVDRGGQTAAMLTRSRLISEARGAPVDILSFDPSPGYDRVRANLRRNGFLTGGMRLLNLYEHYRAHGWSDEPGTGTALPPPPPDLRPVDTAARDSAPWKTAYVDRAGRTVLNDFRRPDGSVYLRAPSYGTRSEDALPTDLIRVGPNHQVLGHFPSLTQWYRRWLDDLVGPEPAFVFVDSRYLLPLLAPWDRPSGHLIYVLHNCHLPSPRRWNTPSTPDYRRALEKLADVDAFVTLTHRQRSDIERAWGQRRNLAVLPSPVIEPHPPLELPARDPARVVVIARLERQKRVDHAVAVMQRVVQQVPEARLEVYGSGTGERDLQAMVERRGLQRSVTLHGYDPGARDQLWTASALLVTSRFEGYPLVVLESMGRGCPVVSYDIPYGPREQIRDGVDGFLVPDGDVEQAAARLVQLLRSPPLVEQQSRAAREAAEQHGEAPYLQGWTDLLAQVVEVAPRRVRTLTADLTLRVALRRPDHLLPRNSRPILTLAGDLAVTTDNDAVRLTGSELSLVAIDRRNGGFAPLAVAVEVADQTLRFTAEVDVVELLRTHPDLGNARLELRLAVNNAFWSTTVRSSARVVAPGVSQTGEGVVRLQPPVPVRVRLRRLRRRWSGRAERWSPVALRSVRWLGRRVRQVVPRQRSR